jgi:hypothetical protein
VRDRSETATPGHDYARWGRGCNARPGSRAPAYLFLHIEAESSDSHLQYRATPPAPSVTSTPLTHLFRWMDGWLDRWLIGWKEDSYRCMASGGRLGAAGRHLELVVVNRAALVRVEEVEGLADLLLLLLSHLDSGPAAGALRQHGRRHRRGADGNAAALRGAPVVQPRCFVQRLLCAATAAAKLLCTQAADVARI